MANKFYAVRVGRLPGVYATWDECKSQVNGYPGAKYKSFPTLEEAQIFAGTKEIMPSQPLHSHKSSSSQIHLKTDTRLVIDLSEKNVTLIPSLAEIETSALNHSISMKHFKISDNEIVAEHASILNLKSIKSEARKKALKDMANGCFIGSVILPYINKSEHLLGSWSGNDKHIVFGSGEQGADRILICKAVGITDSKKGSLLTIDAYSKSVKLHMNADRYEALAEGDSGTVVVNGFDDGVSFLFDARVHILPTPGQTRGHYAYVDGSGVSTKPDGYGWGYVYQNGEKVFTGCGDGISKEANHAAEQDACVQALSNKCSLDEPFTIYFDNTNIAYGLVGWFAISKEYADKVLPLLKMHSHVNFVHVDGHAGVLGNEIADHLSNVEKRREIYPG